MFRQNVSLFSAVAGRQQRIDWRQNRRRVRARAAAACLRRPFGFGEDPAWRRNSEEANRGAAIVLWRAREDIKPQGRFYDVCTTISTVVRLAFEAGNAGGRTVAESASRSPTSETKSSAMAQSIGLFAVSGMIRGGLVRLPDRYRPPKVRDRAGERTVGGDGGQRFIVREVGVAGGVEIAAGGGERRGGQWSGDVPKEGTWIV